jgi:prepilin-type N-terminal cleavage/methylation domain-containing protein
MKNSLLNKKGFTLIELLVVIAIIGVLSSVVLASVNSARQKSLRTAQIKKMQEVGKIFYQTKLESGKNLSDFSGVAPGLVDLNKILSNVGVNSSSYSQFMTDVWGRPMGIDPNEGEGGAADCRSDVIYSSGPDGVNDVWPAAQYDLLPRNDDYLLVIPPITGTCVSSSQKNFEVRYN